FWIMRRVADRSALVRGPLTVVLILTFLSAGLTQILGLHALLGAFVFGVIIAQSPRSNPQLRENLQTLTVGLVGPIFFVLAGMRVDIFSLGSFSTVGTFLLLFAVATVVKAGLGATGALLGGLPRWQAVLVGVGVNLKGGTDVVVAILGFELGLFSGKTYAMYAVLAILTVVVSPPAISFLAKRVKPEPAEEERLNREEARRRSYVPGIERVIVPLVPELLPAAASALVERIAAAKATCDEILDITRLGLSVSREAGQVAEERGTAVPSPVEGDEAEVKKAALEVNEAASKLAQASDHADELTDVRIKVTSEDALEKILDAADGHDLIAMGARRPKPDVMLTLGDLQDRIIDGAKTDVLVAVTDEPEFPGPIRRILVPVSGLRYSMDAGDLAAYLAKASGAELVLFNVITSTLEPIHWGQSDRRQLLASGYRILSELKFTVSRLDIDVRERVELSSDPAAAIVRELQQESYQLVVLGSIDRSADHKIMLGNPVQTILTEGNTPAVLLVSHPEPVEQPVA
ncbi:MAG: cation:proton antiporter, partial [Chloroflexota bacterium]